MNTTKIPEAGTMAHILNTKMSISRLKMVICPPRMLANRRMVNANGFVNSPRNSTGARMIMMGFGTPGTDTISFQYSLVPLTCTMTKVKKASGRVNEVLPDTLAPKGKNGISPSRLVKRMKKNSVSRYGV